MPRRRESYQAYLLRLWSTPAGTWCASLEDAHTGRQWTFATLAQLVAFLEQPPADSAPRKPGAGLGPEEVP